MTKIVLISCCSKKLDVPAPAGELYTSVLFKKSLAFAKTFADEIYVLSARHGLVPLDEVVTPYDESLNDKKATEVRTWATAVEKELPHGNYTYLAGAKYYRYLPEGNTPFKGLGIGDTLQKLKNMGF